MQPIIHIQLRKDKVKDGKCAVILQVYHKGKRKQVFTGLYVAEKNFKDGLVIKQDNASYYNTFIGKKKNEIEREYLTQSIETGTVTIKKKQPTKRDFFTYAYGYFNGQRNRCSADYLDRCISVIKDFHSFSGDLSFEEVTIEVLKDYEDSLFKRELGRNTINRMFKRIKQIFISAGVTWTYKTVTYQQKKRDFLTMDEIELIKSKGRECSVKWYFLLACYTGLRYSDMNLIASKIVTNKGVKRIILGTTKTGEVVSIKLTETVVGILKHITSPIPSNRAVNVTLKDIANDCELRPINFHMGRHSFAVNSASLGIPIEVVSKLLGHSSIRTTQIYYKLTDTKVDEWMDKWT